MICSREELRKQQEAQYMEQAALHRLSSLRQPTPLRRRTSSAAVATGFLGLIIVSAMAGIIALLGAIR